MKKQMKSLSFVGGLLSLLLGVMVLYGWYTHNAVLIQISAALVPMQYNTALCFLLSGLGVIFSVGPDRAGCRNVTIFCGFAVSLLTLLILAEYILDIDLTIDQLFMQAYITDQTSHPGRMAPNTALSFLLVNVAILIIVTGIKDQLSSMITGILSSLVLGLALAAIAGYLISVEAAYGWGGYTRMAAHTAGGFLFLGVSVLSMAWIRGLTDHSRLPVWFPVPVAVVVITITVSLWQAFGYEFSRSVQQPDASEIFPIINRVLLVIGTLFAGALSLTMYFAQSAWRREKAAIEKHLELEIEVKERREAEKALRESELKFRNLFEHSHVSIWEEDFTEVYADLQKLRAEGVTDLREYLQQHKGVISQIANKVKVLHVNQATLNLFAAGIENKFLYQIKQTFTGNALDVFADELCAIWNGDKSFRSEVMFKTLDGQDIFAIISFKIPDTQDGFSSIPVVVNDITDLKRAQFALKENEKILAQTQKMDALGNLTGGIAHDYNNMLGVILGYADLLSIKLQGQPELTKYADQISRAGKRGATLTRKLLSFSRQEPAQVVNVDINNLLREDEDLLVKTLTPIIELTMSLADALWFVSLDASGFEDMLLNLGINALHAMPDGGTLTFITTNETLSATEASRLGADAGDYVSLCIEDTGEGMSAYVKTRIFEPFFSTKDEKGTGLGLSQVYGFVTTMGGMINVDSEPGLGSRFMFYFPRSDKHEEVAPSPEDHQLESAGGNETILIVDDEIALCELAREILSESGYHVLIATSGQQALDILKINTVDVLLTDIIMPQMTGYQLAKHVTRLYPDVKVLLASGFRSDDAEQIADIPFAEPVINKPYSANTLISRIRQCIAKAGTSRILLAGKDPGQSEKNNKDDLSINTISHIEWNDSMSIDDDGVIDRGHKKLVETLNRCYELSRQKDVDNPLHELIKELRDHTVYHFQHEEIAMKVCGYPYIKNHCDVHKMLISKLDMIVNNKSDKEIRGWISSFLADWLLEHLIVMDKAITPFVLAKKELVQKALAEFKE